MHSKAREKLIQWEDPDLNARDASSISGLDYLRGIMDGVVSQAPIARLVGYRLSRVEKGSAVFELNPAEYHYNPFSTVHGGIISTLLDTTMTASVLSTLEKGKGCSTAEIKVNFIRPVTKDTGLIRCEAHPIHVGKKLATAAGKMTDINNRLLAHGSCTCFIYSC